MERSTRRRRTIPHAFRSGASGRRLRHSLEVSLKNLEIRLRDLVEIPLVGESPVGAWPALRPGKAIVVRFGVEPAVLVERDDRLDLDAVGVGLVGLLLALPDARVVFGDVAFHPRKGGKLLPARDVESESIAGADFGGHAAAGALEAVAGESHLARLREDLGPSDNDPAACHC